MLKLGALFGDCRDLLLVVGELELETVCAAGEGGEGREREVVLL